MHEWIYDPDGLIDAYSAYLGVDLLRQRVGGEREIPIGKLTKINELMPTESGSSQLIKKVAVSC